MKTGTVKQIQDLDRIAIERAGIPSLALMENAGRAVAEEARKMLRRARRSRIVVVCGCGNNAGDGFVAARHLLNAGVNVKMFLLGRSRDLKSDTAVYCAALIRCGCPVAEITTVTPALRRAMAGADLVIDAIFGVGLNRPVSGLFQEVIAAVNHTGRKVLAVDIPSGLDGTTGQTYGCCIKAQRTVTFSLSKQGFYRSEGPRHTGKVVVADIGIPVSLIRKVGRRTQDEGRSRWLWAVCF